MRNFSRGGGGAHCKSQFFSRIFPKEVVLRYGCPLLGTHTFKILFLVKGGGVRLRLILSSTKRGANFLMGGGVGGETARKWRLFSPWMPG